MRPPISGIPEWTWQWFGRKPFGFLYAGVSLATIALIPVILRRLFRSGGLIRPAEFLILFGGLQVFFARLNSFLHSSGDTGIPTYMSLETREVVLLALSILGAVVLYAGRRRLPGWLLSILLVLVWCGVYENFPYVMLQVMTKLGIDYRPPTLRTAILAFLVAYIPWNFLYLLPAVLTIRQAWRDAASVYWAEWLGLVLAVARLISWEFALSENLRRSGNYWNNVTSVQLPSLVLASLLCALVLRIWDRDARARGAAQKPGIATCESGTLERSS